MVPILNKVITPGSAINKPNTAAVPTATWALYQAFIDAGKEAGYPETKDYNGYQQEGFGPMHMTVDKGVRASTSNAYLSRAKKRKNFTLMKRVTVHRVLLEETDPFRPCCRYGRWRRAALADTGRFGSP